MISENAKIKKIRTVREVIQELKALDANTALTETALRKLIKEGKIRSIQIGKKNLLTLDDVLEYFH